ncbi:vomeronasal type-2 receptor 26-like [Pleurodeles waltl]|uniref:vomeronasal type-2 receptor 26-like n=1 Tax=Pleurodeles waltl TaxID=8319 RepID=UPI00370945BD
MFSGVPQGAEFGHIALLKLIFSDGNFFCAVQSVQMAPHRVPKGAPFSAAQVDFLLEQQLCHMNGCDLCEYLHRQILKGGILAPKNHTQDANSRLCLPTRQCRAAHEKVPLSVCTPSCAPGSRKMASEGEPACCFLCVPCPQGEISNQTDSTECIKCPWDQWPNAKLDQCIPRTIEVLSFEEPSGLTLAATTIFSSIFPLAVLALFIHQRHTPIVKANNRSLSYLLLLSLTLCFLCSLTFIGYPTPEKCLLRQATFGIIFALCVSCILAKTVMVVIAFNATKPNSDLRKWVGPKLSYSIISVCTLIQVFLCVTWTMFTPPFSEYNINVHPGQIVVQCNEGSPIAFWCMLGYLTLLASISFLVAFLDRNLPSNFNDAKFITFSMLAFLSVWISFIPAYLSTKGKYMVAMEIFAILSSAFALLFCIFIIKCYVILFKPEVNTKEHLMGKEMKGKQNNIKVT